MIFVFCVDDIPQDQLLPVGQQDVAGQVVIFGAYPGDHPPDIGGGVRLVQVVAGTNGVAFAGKFVAGGAEHQPDILVGRPQDMRGLHAGHGAHVDVQQHQVIGVGCPLGQ